MEEKQYISRIKLVNGEVVDIKDSEGRKVSEKNTSDIAALVTSVSTNGATINTIQTAVAAIIQPKESTEISVSATGVIGINEMNVNKLVQTEGDIFIINGGTAV